MPFNDDPTGDAALDGVYYIDLDHWDDVGLFTDYIVTFPENLTFDDAINGAGNVAFEYSFSALDIEGNQILNHDGQADPGISPYLTGPWWSWYRLREGPRVIHSGPITNMHLAHGNQFLSLAGKTWEVYFSRWEYPFDPRDGHLYDWAYNKTFQGNELTASGDDVQGTGQVYQAFNRDTVLILIDLLTNGMVALPRIQFDLVGMPNSGIRTNYQLAVGDDTKFDQIIDGLASTGVGFDYWITHDQKLHTGTPHRYGHPQSPIVSFYLDNTTPGILNLEWDDQGVVATHVLGRGAGLATGTTLGYAVGYGAAQDTFTRLDESYDFGDVRNRDQLEGKTRRQLALDLDALITVSLTLDPHQIGTDFWTTFRKGRCIHVYYDLYFHIVNSYHQIKGYSATVTSEGNVSVDFDLERIVPDHDYTVGNPSL